METPELKACHICVVPLEGIVFDKETPKLVTTLPAELNDLPAGEHFTRSRVRKPKNCSNWIPRKASSNVQYGESEESDSPVKRRKVSPAKPSVSGPSATRVNDQKTRSRYPSRRLPPVPSNSEGDDTNRALLSQPDPKTLQQPSCAVKPVTGSSDIPTKGSFTTKSHTLHKPQKTHKYHCRMCKTGVNSARELVDHHQTVHGIVYCPVCNKPFNNPISMARHKYSHTEKQYHCKKCGESFNFNSELQTHDITHQRWAKHLCTFLACGKIFKNKPDLTRHTETHTSKPMKCLDCNNSTKDKRNFDSHQLKHSKIVKYFCKVCGKGFVFNTQLLRHVAKQSCKAPN